MADITIIMPSFNKEKYIKEALDSVFMQETSYNYHIIVADDCSVDKTVEIVKEYQKKYPEKITLLTSEKNQKLFKNVIRAYAITKTDYFCVLDPDDFWIDKHKIQKALDFLENNKDYTIYVTDTVQQLPNGERKQFIKRKHVIDSCFDDYLKGKAALGCTLGSIFRNIIFKNGLPDKMFNLSSSTIEQSFRGDSFRTAIHLQKGKAHCTPFEDAVYRVTDEGLWMGTSKLGQNLLTANLNKDLWLYFDKKYPEFLVNSHNIFNLINYTLIEELSKIKEDEKILKNIKQLIDLQKLFNENIDLINKLKTKKLPLKYQLRLLLYKKITKKLKKKGLI